MKCIVGKSSVHLLGEPVLSSFIAMFAIDEIVDKLESVQELIMVLNEKI